MKRVLGGGIIREGVFIRITMVTDHISVAESCLTSSSSCEMAVTTAVQLKHS